MDKMTKDEYHQLLDYLLENGGTIFHVEVSGLTDYPNAVHLVCETDSFVKRQVKQLALLKGLNTIIATDVDKIELSFWIDIEG